jgi:hypothetical protein
MTKSKTGYVHPKGKPSGSGLETHGLKPALAVNDLETDILLAEAYTNQEDEPSANEYARPINRNVHKRENNLNNFKA